jgi:hypothetical protein
MIIEKSLGRGLGWRILLAGATTDGSSGFRPIGERSRTIAQKSVAVCASNLFQ